MKRNTLFVLFVLALFGLFVLSGCGVVQPAGSDPVPTVEPAPVIEEENAPAAVEVSADEIPAPAPVETDGYFSMEIVLDAPTSTTTVNVVNLRGVIIQCLGKTNDGTTNWGWDLCSTTNNGDIYTVTHQYASSGAGFSRVKVVGWVNDPNKPYGVEGNLREALAQGTDEGLTYFVSSNSENWGMTSAGNFTPNANEVGFTRNPWATFAYVHGQYDTITVSCGDNSSPIVLQKGNKTESGETLSEAAIWFETGTCQTGTVTFHGIGLVGPYER